MEPPNRHLVDVPREKITHYPLNVNHPHGRGKAGLLPGKGYNENNVEALAGELVVIAQTQPVAESRQTPFGIDCVIYGFLSSPDGKELLVRTVWFIADDGIAPSLATAYPRSRNEWDDP